MNLHDPIPGPLLLCGDGGTGKTDFLQMVACAVGQMHQPEEVQFGVLTSHPDEWSGLEEIPNNVGVFPLYHRSAEDFILTLASWAHGNKTSQQSVLLMLDDLEAATNLDFDAKQSTLAVPAGTGPPGLADHHIESRPHGKYHALVGCVSYNYLWAYPEFRLFAQSRR